MAVVITSRYKHYTNEQREWLLEKSQMGKYRTEKGRVRLSKLRGAFERHFGETRSKQAIGYTLWKLTHRPERRPARAEVVADTFTLSEIEGRLNEALKKIAEVKGFTG